MNEHMTVAELFYCLIQDIEDYTMTHDNCESLDIIVEKLCNIKTVWDTGELLYENNIKQLEEICEHFDKFKYYQFAEDLNVILERVR